MGGVFPERNPELVVVVVVAAILASLARIGLMVADGVGVSSGMVKNDHGHDHGIGAVRIGV